MLLQDAPVPMRTRCAAFAVPRASCLRSQGSASRCKPHANAMSKCAPRSERQISHSSIALRGCSVSVQRLEAGGPKEAAAAAAAAAEGTRGGQGGDPRSLRGPWGWQRCRRQSYQGCLPQEGSQTASGRQQGGETYASSSSVPNGGKRLLDDTWS